MTHLVPAFFPPAICANTTRRKKPPLDFPCHCTRGEESPFPDHRLFDIAFRLVEGLAVLEVGEVRTTLEGTERLRGVPVGTSNSESR